MASFLSIPDEIKLKVLSFLSYDEIAKLRLVCQDVNRVCMDALNIGFGLVENLHAAIQRDIRSKLPRRESERREHKFSRHADILSAIETRLSLIQITYAKYIEAGYTCFIPGKVLDELFKVLRYVRTAKEPPRSHEVLMELRDISSMAMEHFEEKILPPLRKLLEEEGVTILPGGVTVGLDSSETRAATRRSFLKRMSIMSSPECSPLAKKRRLSTDFDNSIAESSRNETLVARVAECERIIQQQDAKIEAQSNTLNEFLRKLEDYNHRFNDLADVLSNHYESSLLQDKIASLIQPVRGADYVPPISDDSSVSTPTGYTAVVAKPSRRFGVANNKSPEQRIKILKDDMVAFRDQCKF